MKNILFFDTWTKGIRNFSRLAPELKDANCSFKLVHLESWNNPNTPIFKSISGIDCYDISYFKTNNIFKVIKHEKPDVVLILSLSYLLDKTIVSICHKLGIKVVYLSHGKIYMKEGVGTLVKDSSFLQKINKQMSSKTSKILLNYMFINTFLFFKPKRIFSTLKQYLNKADKTMFTPYSKELEVEKALVYYQSEKIMFEEKRKFPQGMVSAIGNPEMDYIVNAPIKERNSFLSSIGLKECDKYLLYLDDGFVQENILSKVQWLDFVTQISNICNGNGLKLLIKLHPRTKASDFEEHFSKNNVYSFADVDFKNIIHYSDFVMSHSSSTIVYAIYLKKVILLPRWGNLIELIRNYPAENVYYIESIDKFSDAIKYGLPSPDQKKYLKDNVGITDGKSINRIINALTSV